MSETKDLKERLAYLELRLSEVSGKLERALGINRFKRHKNHSVLHGSSRSTLFIRRANFALLLCLIQFTPHSFSSMRVRAFDNAY